MPVNARWLEDEQPIVIYEFVGRWTMDELHEAFAAERRMIAGLARPSAYISDYSRSSRIPLDIVLKAGDFLPLMDTEIPTYVVHADTIVRFMAEAVLKLLPGLSIRFARDLEEARQQIAATKEKAIAVQQGELNTGDS